MSKYHAAYIFTKRTNLLGYFRASVDLFDPVYEGQMERSPVYQAREKYYAHEREVKLMLLVRVEGTKMYCRIKCPINPLPVCGEFEAPSFTALRTFLISNGWAYKEKFGAKMFE